MLVDTVAPFHAMSVAAIANNSARSQFFLASLDRSS